MHGLLVTRCAHRHLFTVFTRSSTVVVTTSRRVKRVNQGIIYWICFRNWRAELCTPNERCGN